MANKLANRVKVTVSGTPGTGAITLNTALSGFQTFAAGGVSNGDTVPYVIEDGSAWEIGVGTYSSTGPTLTRTSITASSNSGSAISASANCIVMLSPLAADLQIGSAVQGWDADLDAIAAISGTSGLLKKTAANTWSLDTTSYLSGAVSLTSGVSGTLPVTSGGTGLTSLTSGYIPFGNGTGAFGSSSSLFWDSANARLGIGNSSPLYQFQANSSSAGNVAAWVYTGSTGGGPVLKISNGFSSTSPIYTFWYNDTTGIGNPASNVISFINGGTERMRVDSSGQVAIGATTTAGTTLALGKNITGSATSSCLSLYGTIQSDVTTSMNGISSYFSTAAASFTLSVLRHFSAIQATIGSGSTVTSQYGFYADGSITGATNNYGFYSNIASGTGRWNFYAAGTAQNYFAGQSQHANGSAAAPTVSTTSGATGIFWPDTSTVAISTSGSERMRIDASGNVGIGSTTSSSITLRVNKNITGGATSQQILSQGVVQSDVTTAARGYQTYLGTANAAFTLAELTHYFVSQDAFGALSTVTNQYGFNCGNITGATNNYGFYSNIASGTGRWNFYAAGTAANYFAGNVSIGTTSSSARLHVQGAVGSDCLWLTDNDRSSLAVSFPSASVTQIATPYSQALVLGTNAQERLRIDSSGNVGIGTSSPSTKLDVNADKIRVRTAKTPSSATDTGSQGDVCWDSGYVYVCTATNTWKRAAIATW